MATEILDVRRVARSAGDSIGLAGGSNLHLYAPNPVMWTDPSGLVRLRDTDPKLGSLNDIQTRCWYKREEQNIDQQLCNCKNLKQKARLAHKLRNQARICVTCLLQTGPAGV